VAKQLGTAEQPVWRFTLPMPSQEPFMTYLGRRVTAAGNVDRCGRRRARLLLTDNTALVSRILELSRKKPALLGKAKLRTLFWSVAWRKSGVRALAFLRRLSATGGRGLCP